MEKNYMDYITNNEKIILDTSAAMHYKGFQKFVDQAKDILLSTNKKIIVMKVVWLELVRAYNSKDQNKQEAANRAIGIISCNRAVFEIEDEEVFQYELENAFADKVLLSSIILEKTDAKILLITNDRMLSKDALGINHQSSCRGHKVETCFITDSGKLKPGFSSWNEEDEEEQEHKVEVKEVVRYVEVPVAQKNESWIPKVLIPVATLGAGFALGKYSNQIVKLIKSVA